MPSNLPKFYFEIQVKGCKKASQTEQWQDKVNIQIMALASLFVYLIFMYLYLCTYTIYLITFFVHSAAPLCVSALIYFFLWNTRERDGECAFYILFMYIHTSCEKLHLYRALAILSETETVPDFVKASSNPCKFPNISHLTVGIYILHTLQFFYPLFLLV